MEDTSIGQYRSHDPPKNFSIRVKLWKVTTGSVVPNSIRYQTDGSAIQPTVGEDAYELAEKDGEEPEKEDIIVHWQEKLFSEEEFDKYLDPLNCITVLQKKYHDDVKAMQSTHGGRTNKRIFTYTDSDMSSLLEEFRAMTLSENEERTHLDEKMMNTRHGNLRRRNYLTGSTWERRQKLVIDRPSEVVKGNHVITTPSKSMQVMANLGTSDTNEQNNFEHILCTIKIDANGMIVVKPDIELKEVITIEAYQDARTKYQYSIEHASTPMKKHEREQEARLFKELYTRHENLMVTHVGNELSPMPKSTELFVYVFGEIVSARNFEYDSIYIQYFLDLPSGWQSPGKSLSGVTHCCSMNNDFEAFFSFPFEFQLQYTLPHNKETSFIRWPTLYLEVLSYDNWQRYRCEGYGFVQLSDIPGSVVLEIDTWRPKGEGVTPDLNRFFIGGNPSLEDITYSKSPSGTEDVVHSKFYFRTVSSGTVTVRMNTIHQTKDDENAPDISRTKLKWTKTSKKLGAFSAGVDALTQVLDQFQTARKRMLAARATLPSIK